MVIDPRQCAQCGAELVGDAPDGLCAACASKSHSEGRSNENFADTSPWSSRFAAPKVQELARHFPQLEILELLGQGGMGAVYKARQPTLDRLVAVKILPAEVAGDLAFAERFMREARALARLNHPNIVGIHDFGQADGLYYFVMEFVDGVSLRQLVGKREITPRQALALVPQMCEALQFAHDEGIIHRDIKPENILIDKRGRVKIADFGLAKLLSRSADEATLTRAEQVMGTPLYMAPEQMQASHAVDHRADIYSLGVVFYEMLTGELPLGRFAPPSQKVEVDVRLDEVVLKALEREPGRRYQQASDVKTDVESIVTRPVSAAAEPLADEAPVQLPREIQLRRHIQTEWRSNDASLVQLPREIQGPAMGMIFLGILGCGGTALGAFPVLELIANRNHAVRSHAADSIAIVSITLLFAAWAGFILAGWKMLQCRAYILAVTASLLSILAGPLTVVGLPIGIWSLLILSRRNVRDAFSAVRKAHMHAAGAMKPGERLLLDETDRFVRSLQHLCLVAGLILLAVGATAFFDLLGILQADDNNSRRVIDALAAAILFLIGGSLLLIFASRIRQRWEIEYHGHSIRFENNVLMSRRLTIDGQVVATGGMGLRTPISARIPSGPGTRDLIVARTNAGFLSYRCRLFARSETKQSATALT